MRQPQLTAARFEDAADRSGLRPSESGRIGRLLGNVGIWNDSASFRFPTDVSSIASALNQARFGAMSLFDSEKRRSPEQRMMEVLDRRQDEEGRSPCRRRTARLLALVLDLARERRRQRHRLEPRRRASRSSRPAPRVGGPAPDHGRRQEQPDTARWHLQCEGRQVLARPLAAGLLEARRSRCRTGAEGSIVSPARFRRKFLPISIVDYMSLKIEDALQWSRDLRCRCPTYGKTHNVSEGLRPPHGVPDRLEACAEEGS